MKSEKAWNSLIQRHRRISEISSVYGLLGWDEQVNLPPGSSALRGRQYAVMAEWIHNESSRPEIGDELAELESDLDNLSPEQKVIVSHTRKDFDRMVKIPAEFVARKATASSQSYQAWVNARKEDDFSIFSPYLKEQFELSQEEVGYLEVPDAYDYYIDHFDPGMDSAQIETLFEGLKSELLPLVKKIAESPIKAKQGIFCGFPVAEQERFLREVVKRVGFDFDKGRIDTAVHPFCSGHPIDCRMTTRFDIDNPLDSWSSALHETGHALYEQGLPEEWLDTPMGQAVGMAIHESQSRMWENQIGRSRQFWHFWEPRYRELFPTQLANVTSDELFLAINKVEITPIRVDADEVTYNLHIMLRFEIEKAFFRDGLKVDDLPEFWNDKSENILGFRPKNNREGCLQDVHWSSGAFGYFPSYCLGNMLAAQIWYALRDQLPDIDEKISQAQFQPILNWLREQVHHRGRRYSTSELIHKISGKELSSQYLVRYLKERYLPLYR